MIKFMPNLDDILDLAVNAAHSAASGLRETRMNSNARVLKRTKHDVKLSADINSEKIITETIIKERPQDGIIAEEGGESQIDNDGVWIIDPLDGTVNFSHGHPHFCVSIAWLWKGEISVGVIYDVVRDELFTAAKGRGATLNGQKILVAKTVDLGQSMIGVGFGQSTPQGEGRNNFNTLGAKVQKLRISGSAALDLAYVACGRLDAYVESSVFVWDLAAGSIIIEEAGGKTCMWHKERPFSRSCIAANKDLFDKIINLLPNRHNYARTCLDDFTC